MSDFLTPSYQALQKQLFDDIEQKFQEGKTPSELLKPIPLGTQDRRRTLTCVIYLPTRLQNKVAETVIEPLRGADPSPYYYSPSSFHITLKNIRSPAYPLTYDGELIEQVQRALVEAVPSLPKLEFSLQGLFELPVSMAIRCYTDTSLKKAIDHVAEKLANHGVYDDKKYASTDVYFGNVSFCRFNQPPNQQFQELVRELKNIELGTFVAEGLSLVTFDTLASVDSTKVIQKFALS